MMIKVCRPPRPAARKTMAYKALLATSLWTLSLLGEPLLAHPVSGNLASNCRIVATNSSISVYLDVDNTTEQQAKNLTAGLLDGTNIGDASVFINVTPGRQTILPGKRKTFRWRGEIFGNGFLDLTVSVTGTWDDGDPATTGLVNCPRLTVGDPASLTPPPTNTEAIQPTFGSQPTATPSRRDRRDTPVPVTRAPTNTRRPTRTPIPPRPTRTRIPTSTRRPPSTPIERDTPGDNRPTRTPDIGGEPTPERRVRPTRTPIVGRATRTPIGGRATRTPVPQRPTRTPIQLRPTRTPRGANVLPTVPREGQVPAEVVGRLTANCSLRQTNDQIAVRMVVQNTTAVMVTDLAASFLDLTPEGGALFFDPTGPSPRSYGIFAPGDSVVFEWGGRMNDVGVIGFAASVAGTSPGGNPVISGLIDCGFGSGPNGSFDSSLFTGSCSIRTGRGGAVTLLINNRSGEPMSEIDPRLIDTSSTGTAQVNSLRGPAPRRLRRLAGGQTQEFLWEADVLGSGNVSMTFQADGTVESGDRISTPTITCSTELAATGGLPDLSVDELDQRGSWVVEEQFFGPGHCALFEGCVGGSGVRRLLKFNTTTPNHGPGDLFLGDPTNNPEFIFSECHQHFHFEDYAIYRLLDMNGNQVAQGHKQAFCLVDLWRPPGSNGARNPGFPDCGFQGISAGWADVYHRDLDCQWIDITNVPDGRYILEVHINPARVVQESNYANNIARNEVCIGIPEDDGCARF